MAGPGVGRRAGPPERPAAPPHQGRPELQAAGVAYWCDCTPEQVQARARERGGPPGYDGHCRDRGLAQGPGTALRFRAPDEGTTSFDDLVRGTVTFENAKLEDFVLLRSNGMPTFLLANVVDDADMGITHVVRGEEHVNGTPEVPADRRGARPRPPAGVRPPAGAGERAAQEAVQAARRDGVGGRVPRGATCPRRWSTTWPRWGGGRPTAWRSGRSPRSSSCSGSTTSRRRRRSSTTKKLTHFNAEYIRALDTDEFVARARPFFAHGDATEAVLRPLAELVQERVRLLTEVEPMVDFLRPTTSRSTRRRGRSRGQAGRAGRGHARRRRRRAGRRASGVPRRSRPRCRTAARAAAS